MRPQQWVSVKYLNTIPIWLPLLKSRPHNYAKAITSWITREHSWSSGGICRLWFLTWSQVLRDEIGTTMTNIKSRAAQINFPSPHMVRKGRGRRSDSSRKGVPSYMGHTLCVPQEKLDPRIFPATIVLQAHEEKCRFMKKFDSRIPNAADLRQQWGRNGSSLSDFNVSPLAAAEIWESNFSLWGIPPIHDYAAGL